MNWVAPQEKDEAIDALEKRLWEAADQMRANSGLTSQQPRRASITSSGRSSRKPSDMPDKRGRT